MGSLMPERYDLMFRLGHGTQERNPVRELAPVLDRHELQVELELLAVRSERGRLGLERPVLEHVLHERVEDRLMPLDDAEDQRRLTDHVIATATVNRAET